MPTKADLTPTSLGKLDKVGKKDDAVAKKEQSPTKYVMRISRLTIDKLGVKLYDTVSAAVAELVSNAYDADARNVTISTPVGVQLSASDIVEVVDDGHGMTPTEARSSFLVVGRDRRLGKGGGGLSRKFKRPVMGRKGIGKLAPFGICRQIELITAGGELTPKGYLVAHFTMDFDRIVEDAESDVSFDPGPLDQTFLPKSGTTIRLTNFLKKKVPARDVLERQIGRRFTVDPKAMTVIVKDPSGNSGPVPVFNVPMVPATVIDVSTRPVELETGETLKVTGAIGMAIESYRNEEMAGVRIYAREKLVATTRDFEQPAGFTGEFTTRSYLVGSIRADWLDLDDGDDLVRTDRQGILWESEYGSALRKWGAELIKEVGKKSKGPRRKNAQEKFLERSAFRKRATEKFKDASVVDVAVDLASKIGSFAAQDELDDDEYIDDLSEIILSVAPHKALMEALKEFAVRVVDEKATITQLAELFGKSRVAEMASYSQIAAERVRIIEHLDSIIFAEPAHEEMALQKLIADAPWLIEPTWAVITSNKQLQTFSKTLQKFLSTKAGASVQLSFEVSTKRPDFLLVSVGSMLHLVELKKVGHSFDDADCDRLLPYFDWMEEFFAQNPVISQQFSRGFRIDLIADAVNLKHHANRKSMASYEQEGRYRRRSWTDFLERARQAHQAFLEINAVSKKGD